MRETPEDLARLQDLLDTSAASAGPHMSSIITAERRVDAAGLCERLQGMCLLVLATVTADGRPLVGPVDSIFWRGSFWFSSGRTSVRMRHLSSRPAVSASHLPAESFAVTVHGQAELFDLRDPAYADYRQAVLEVYIPRQGPEFEQWFDTVDAVGARIAADKMFSFCSEGGAG